jgi:hypothetical protein
MIKKYLRNYSKWKCPESNKNIYEKPAADLIGNSEMLSDKIRTRLRCPFLPFLMFNFFLFVHFFEAGSLYDSQAGLLHLYSRDPQTLK